MSDKHPPLPPLSIQQILLFYVLPHILSSKFVLLPCQFVSVRGFDVVTYLVTCRLISLPS